ncbi:ABC transporter [Lentzea sp. NBRC 105346]|uniref:ABC transporter permease n=1 Tax=Lentzea sp. NBRC 105346 TaxID=3032205 RepID=UPI0024A38B0B|nr:ABC transporter permease [Lentzea sp. NBRC 105346]GLZ35562.1 ABC transporter [Lentzea sp. NBRC 105346]
MRTFGAILWRDTFVTGRELPSFLAQVIIQPFFILFIFAKVLGDIGYVQGDFATVLLPGIIAMNGFLGALQNTTLPLVLDFSWTREIEDRLLAPISIPFVAVEKIVFGAIRGLLSALLMVPVGFIMLDVTWPVEGLAGALLIIILGTLAGASVGMVIGTSVPPRRINVMFAVILTPLLFTGSAQFPWTQLDHLRWFQIICALNPLTYVSEGMRAELAPAVPHIPYVVCLAVLTFATLIFGALGMRGFLRRSLD